MELDKLPTDVCFRGGQGSAMRALIQKDLTRVRERPRKR